MNIDEYVSMKELAGLLGMDRSHARRYVLGLGFKLVKMRTPDSGNQLALAVTREQAHEILRRRKTQGFLSTGKAVVDYDKGVFYVVQLVPELDPRRIKLGFAANISERLAQHRTAAPTAEVLKIWPCQRVWEASAIDCLSQGCTHIGGEVFQCDDVEELLGRGDAFFTVMPSLSDEDSPKE